MAENRGARSGVKPEASSPRRLEGLPGFLPAADNDPTEGLVSQRVRLSILGALSVNTTLTFSELKGLLQVTDGNLAVHARKLENAALIECTKSFQGRVPRTEYKLSEAGRHALERYLNHMEALIHATRRTS